MATQQQVMKSFMQTLDTTTKSGRSALDAAIKASSSFNSYQEVVEKFTADRKAAGNWHKFLVKYCGIILDNKDTGAITGSDAGGSTTKGATDIISATGNATYPSGSSFTVNGLTIYGVPDREDLTEDEQYVVQGLYSWWLKGALDLIEESYGLSYAGTNTTNSRMKLRLFDDDNISALAYVDPSETDLQKLESRTLAVNMSYFQNMSSSDRHGEAEYANLDRTLAHELTHGVMASNVDYMMDLPLAIIEGGTAELIHGIDDERREDIIACAKDIELVTNALNTKFNGGNEDSPYEVYAGGYIFMRYFLKQAATTTFDYDTRSANVSVDSLSFATNYHDSVTMTGSSAADTITNSGKRVLINALGGANTIKNYSSRVTITSGKGKDDIENEGSNVTITSGAGADAIENSGSKVSIIASSGKDSIENSGSNVTITSGADSDYIYNNGSKARISLSTGNDSITNTYLGVNSTIFGGAGKDTITNYAEKVYISGGTGIDIISNNSANVTIRGGDGADKITNTGEKSIVQGDASNDSIINGEGTSTLSLFTTVESDNSSVGANSTIYGGAGNDSITNYAMSSFIYGDADNDIIVNGEEGNSYSTVESSLGAYSTIYGGTGLDTITNYAMNSFISAKEGSDYVINSGKFTTIYGGADDDFIENGGNSSTLYGGAGNDEIYNEGTFLKIYGGSDNDFFANSGASATVYGGDGSDSIKNDADSSSLYGGASNDSIYNSGDKIYLSGGAGKDSLRNCGSLVTISGGTGTDYFYNEGSEISISAGAGNDTIRNYGDHITISAGAGNDSIRNYGGKHLTYRFGQSSGKDTVVGFNANDTIKITSGTYSSKKSGSNVIVTVGNSTLTLKNATGKKINFISSSGKTSTKTFSTSSTAAKLWFAEENNFVADDLSSIVEVTPAIAYDEIQTMDSRSLMKNNLITYSGKKTT